MRHLLLLLLACLSLTAHAGPVSEHDMKAAYIYRIAQYTEWPDTDQESFNLCVLGDDNIVQALRKYEGRNIGNRRVAVAGLTTLVAIRKCQVLYVGGDEVVNLGRIERELGDEPVLTMTDVPQLAKVGVVLVLENQRLAFEVNFDLCRRLNLRPASNLLRLARYVRKS